MMYEKSYPFPSLVKVGNTYLPEASEYKSNTATIVDSARNVKGMVVGTVIRDDVAKVELNWRYLTVRQWADINALFAQKRGGKFYNSVTFFDQAVGDYVTKQMYVSDRSAGMFRRNPKTGEVMGWTDCRIALVEV